MLTLNLLAQRDRALKKLLLSYGVHHSDAIAFVESDKSAKTFLARYHDRTYNEYLRAFCLFFNWLKQKKEINITPTELLNKQLMKSRKGTIEERRWAATLAIEFCRDNPDYKEHSNTHSRIHWNVIDQFFKYFEVPFCGCRNPLGTKAGKRKYKPKALTREDAKKLLTALSPRERAIAFSMLQSGMAVEQCLEKFNFMLPYVQKQLKAGAERIRIDFDERKGNGFTYFTFIGSDAIQQLRVWLSERERWIQKHSWKLSPKAQNAIFISRTGEVITISKFQRNFASQLYRKGIKTKPYEIVSHQLGKIFKTESSPPERNIDGGIVEFMLGHKGGIDAVGGPYDLSPEVHQLMVEKEYQKLEPSLNLFSETIEQPSESQALKEIQELGEKIKKIENLASLAYTLKILKGAVNVDQEKDSSEHEKFLRALLSQETQKILADAEAEAET